MRTITKFSLIGMTAMLAACSTSKPVAVEPALYTNDVYHFSFQYPSDRKVFDAGPSGLAASLNLMIVPNTEAFDDTDAVTVRIYEKPNWSDTDGWIGDDSEVSKVLTQGNRLVQIWKGEEGDADTMNMVRSTFKFTQY